MTKAVVDVGSNSVLLTVGRLCEGALQSVHETSVVTGLGRGTKSTGLLSEAGIRSTLDALLEAFETAARVGSGETVAAATMAVRIATNAPRFLELAERQGTPVFVLSGEDEAEWGFRAVSEDPLFRDCPRLSVIDVGGQSTELSTSWRTQEGWRDLFRRSFPIGALGLRETSLKPDPAGPGDRLAAVEQVDNALSIRYLPHQAGTVVTLGATGTNLVSVKARMAEWDPERVHGSWLGYEEVSRSVDELCGLDDAGRASLVGIEKGREHTLHAGALILERALFATGAEGCYVSVNGWRTALLRSRLLAE